MTTVALFGGSFNPVHVAHQLVALYVLETQPVDELWLVPTWAHPFGKPLAPFGDRVAMCALAAAALGPRVQVSRAEEELARKPGFVASRTLDLIEHLGGDLRLVIGSDILAETAKWYRWDEVCRRAPPIVVARPGFPGGGEVAITDVSATRVRELLAAGDPAAAQYVPAGVLRYIAEHGLYDAPHA
ncbi:MAG: nicotinate-nicotinamide nucleotide adenylyltransferase [Acidobacteriota bacterium]